MIGTNWLYNGLDMSDSKALENGFIITNVTKDIVLNTEIYNNQNTHWAKTSYTLAWARIFTFEGECFWITKQERYNAWIKLNSVIQPQPVFRDWTSWFWTLRWEEDSWELRTCSAKVYTVPNPVNWLDDPIIRFTFALICENAEYTGTTTNSVSITYNTDTTVSHWWKFYAKPRFEIYWTIQNPTIENESFFGLYSLETTINELYPLVIDFNTYTIEYNGDNYAKYRKAWSTTVYLRPWNNTIKVYGTGVSWTPTITCTYKDTFIHN